MQVETLRRVAKWGAAFTAVSTYGMYHYMQSLLSKGDYYVKSVEVAKNSPDVKAALGDNIVEWRLQLWDSRNVITLDSANVVIPIAGSRAKGALHVDATRPMPDPKQPSMWEINTLRLEVLSPQRSTISIVPPEQHDLSHSSLDKNLS